MPQKLRYANEAKLAYYGKRPPLVRDIGRSFTGGSAVLRSDEESGV